MRLAVHAIMLAYIFTLGDPWEIGLTLGNRCQYPGWIFPSADQVHEVYNDVSVFMTTNDYNQEFKLPINSTLKDVDPADGRIIGVLSTNRLLVGVSSSNIGGISVGSLQTNFLTPNHEMRWYLSHGNIRFRLNSFEQKHKIF